MQIYNQRAPKPGRPSIFYRMFVFPLFRSSRLKRSSLLQPRRCQMRTSSWSVTTCLHPGHLLTRLNRCCSTKGTLILIIIRYSLSNNFSKYISSNSLNDYTNNWQSGSYLYLGRTSNMSMDLSEWCLLRTNVSFISFCSIIDKLTM